MPIIHDKKAYISGDELKRDPVRIIELAQEVEYVIILDNDGLPCGAICTLSKLPTFAD